MTSPRTLLKSSNLLARKELGQNFLTDPSLAAHIVDLAGIGGDEVVLEIGAGLGAMTIAAARRARRIIAVETDRQLVPLLRGELLANGLDPDCIRVQNIFSVDLGQLADAQDQPLTVMGNLPYNISSQVLVKLIRERRAIRRAVLMFQKELADRLCAVPGNRIYGRLSVMLQYCAHIRVLKTVRPEMFFPKPKVASVVLAIDFKTTIEPRASDEALLARVVQAAFGQRRKTLRNALSGGILPLDGAGALQVLQMAHIDPRRRAETLSVSEFVTLTDAVQRFVTTMP